MKRKKMSISDFQKNRVSSDLDSISGGILGACHCCVTYESKVKEIDSDGEAVSTVSVATYCNN